MAKINLEYHRIPYGSNAWYDYRKTGIGGSEIGTLMGVDEYGNLAKLYHQKVGVIEFPPIDSEAMFNGRNLEEYVADKWKHWWDGEYIENHKKGNKIRNCRNVNAFVRNPKYPWLYASVDRLINKNMPALNGVILTEGGILELKTISSFEANKWKTGVPQKYVLQVHQYMMIFELDYAEIAVFKDGRYFELFAIERNEDIVKEIAEKSEYFWKSVILPGKKWAEKYHEAERMGNKSLMEEALEHIDQYEPSPEGSKSYREFMNERYVKEHDFIMADETDMKNAIIQKLANQTLKEVEKIKLEAENNLRKKFVDTGAEYIHFGDGYGRIRNYFRKNSTSPTLDNRIKFDEPTEELERLHDIVKLKLHEIKEDTYSAI